ncbi:hypothetical protein NCCP133_17750 [Cytobacillus sp. NCCP-133]|nr:hypothetical protein NCCP133_17750 [Cytobacillus sp. NCCP-133]
MRVPEYGYEELRKGVPCGDCMGFLEPYSIGILICPTCGSKEKLESAVLKSVKEYKTLFPERKITTNSILEWCNVTRSKKVIQKILWRKYEKQGHGKCTFYINKKSDGGE